MDIDELKSKLETELSSATYEIEKGAIQRFVQAIDDPNPLWQVIAPPTFILTVGYEQFSTQSESLLGPRLHGGTDLECYEPVRPGDIITVTNKIVGIRERQGRRLGRMVFVNFEVTYKNQRQEMVAKCRQTVIGY